MQSFLASGERMPAAFFCECDYIAISAMKTLGELGFRIPEDVAIVGFDDIIESHVVSPELTTVHVAKEQLAYQAVDLLVRMAEGDESVKTKVKVDTSFIERASTARR
ncbi:substrate-binding domain-containing protein [Paenibacillus sp. TRM 82003]|nr:substrate-binding domain-containing protein [Paenibacillus sp. TRM 82003]